MFGLIAIFFSFLMLTSNPTRSYESARNSERMAEISQLMSAIDRWIVTESDFSGKLTHSGGREVPLCKGTQPDFTNGIPFPSLDIAKSLVSENYLAEFPQDPQFGRTPYYNICYTSTGTKITIYAPNVEGERVSLTR